MKEELNSFFAQGGFRILNESRNGKKLYYKVKEGNQLKIIIVCQISPSVDGEIQEYIKMIDKLRQDGIQQGYHRVEVLTIFFTFDVETVRSLVEQEELLYWIVDMNRKRLIIYENQPSDFYDAKKIIESYLYKEHSISSSYETHAHTLPFDKNLWKRICIGTTLLLLINVFVFLWLEYKGSTLDSVFMYKHGASSTAAIYLGHEYYRLFTSMFLHFGFPHLVNNMVVLVVAGTILEKQVGTIKYLIIYLLGGIGGNLLSLGVDIFLKRETLSAGASGAVYAVIGGILAIILIYKGRMPGLSGGSLGARLSLMVILMMYQGFSTTGIDNYAHIGGLISGFLLTLLLYRRKKDEKTRKENLSYD